MKLDIALEIAKEAHKNTTRHDGKTPYINHIYDVLNILDSMKIKDIDVFNVAALHDAYEDSINKKSFFENMEEKFGHKIASKVVLLSHEENETYEQYINNLTEEKDCIIVKIADIISNLSDEPTFKQKEKYKNALPKLISMVNEK